MKNPIEILSEKIQTDPDFVNYPALDNSLKKVLKAHPEGLSVDKIAKALMLTEEQVNTIMAAALSKFKEAVTDDEDLDA